MKILENEKISKVFVTTILMLALILGCVGSNATNDLNPNSVIVNNIVDEGDVQAKDTNNVIEQGNAQTKITNNTIEDNSQTKSSNDTKNETVEQIKNMYVVYNSHVQDIGWEKDFSKTNGEESGTTGQNKKNEAIKIKLINAPKGVGVTYQSYIEGKKWQDWVKDGAISGTTGQNRKLEAIKIKLTGTQEYSIEYRTHVQDIGWKDWVKDGAISGVVGKGLKVEAIEIRVIPKKATVIYQSHVQDIGWEQYVYDGDVSGTVGKGLKVEAVKIQLKNTDVKIQYQTHIQDIGWEKNWKENGQESGTTGQNKKIEAIKIKTSDTKKYSVMYRVYLQELGWQKWVKDGEVAGTTGQNRRLEAIEIKIVESTDFSVTYQTHIQNVGWENKFVTEGKTSGLAGNGLSIEAIKIVGKNIPKGVKIQYQTHIQDIGWEKNWKENGQESGTTGQAKKIEAIKIKLEGTEEYSVLYRTYVQGRGWQKWANDGEISGTTGKNLRIEAIEIKIEPKIGNKITSNFETQITSTMYSIKDFKMKGWLMTNVKNAKIQVLIDNKVVNAKIARVNRQDVLDEIKGYGGQDNNPKPGYEIILDLSSYNNKSISIKVQYIDENNKVLDEVERKTTIKEIGREEGVYGRSGLKIAGRGGSDLKYLKFGNGENVFFATFAIHGYEDLWNKDGNELVDIANAFYNRLINDKDYDLAQKWTIYVFPGVNQDGLKSGWTNNGPGRTTLYSAAPGNKGIDLNRCWQIGNSYTRYTDARNYNGTSGFQAYEAQSLRDFLLSKKSQSGQTLLVDLHGWTQQLIGDPTICSYYEKQFPENDKSAVGRYGEGYMVNWARTYLGSSGKPAKTALIELPYQGVNGHQSVVNKNFTNRYIEATLSMLKSI